MQLLNGRKITIHQHCNTSSIEGDSLVISYLREKTSYIKEGVENSPAGQKGWNGKSYIIKDGKFKTGFLNRILKHLEPFTVEVELIDHIPAIKYDSYYDSFEHMMRDYQRNIVEKCLNSKLGIVKAATNAGKSYPIQSIAKTCESCGVITLIVVHNQLIYNQLKKSLSSHTEVGYIESTKVFLAPITIAMEATLFNRYTKVDAIFEYLQNVQCLLIDEVHRAGGNRYQKVINGMPNLVMKIGFSGTPLDGSQESALNVEGTFGDILVDITNQEMIAAGVSSETKVVVFRIPYIMSKCSYKSAKELVYKSTRRLRKLIEIIEKGEREILIVVQELKHGEWLKEMLSDYDIPILHGKLSSLAKEGMLTSFYNGKYKAMITTSVIQEGVDTQNVRSIVYMLGGKSEIKLKQTIGRGLRKKEENNTLTVYDFFDYIQHFQEQAEERIKIYEQEGFPIEFK